MMHSKKSGIFLHNWLPSRINLQWTSVNYVGFAKWNRILNIDPGSLIWSMNWGACFQGAEEDTPEVWLPRCITWNLKVDGDEHRGDHLACHVIPKLNVFAGSRRGVAEMINECNRPADVLIIFDDTFSELPMNFLPPRGMRMMRPFWIFRPRSTPNWAWSLAFALYTTHWRRNVWYEHIFTCFLFAQLSAEEHSCPKSYFSK